MSSNRRSALTIYMISLIRSYLLSPAMYMGLLFMAVIMGIVGARGAHMPIVSWFSIIYPLFTFSIAGGLARSTLIGAAAFNYLTKHGGVSPARLSLTIVLAASLTQMLLAPLFTVLLIATYYFAGVELGALSITPVFIPAILLSALFTSALGVAIGLTMAGKTFATRVANVMPTLLLPLFMVSAFTPAGLRPYNPFTALMILLAASLSTNTGSGITSSTLSDLLVSYATLSIATLTLLILAIVLMTRVVEVNIYEVSTSI